VGRLEEHRGVALDVLVHLERTDEALVGAVPQRDDRQLDAGRPGQLTQAAELRPA